jgi:hypothetical protein
MNMEQEKDCILVDGSASSCGTLGLTTPTDCGGVRITINGLIQDIRVTAIHFVLSNRLLVIMV